MTIKIENFKNKILNKPVKLLGSTKTKFSASKLKNFMQRSREKRYTYLNERLEQWRYKYELTAKNYDERKDEKGITKEVLSSYKDAMAYYKSRMEAIQKKLDNLSDKINLDEIEFEVSDIREYYPDLTAEDVRRLSSYYDKESQMFKFGGREIKVNDNTNDMEKVYDAIYEEYKNLEAQDSMKEARNLESYGVASCGDNFIMNYASLNDENREKFQEDLVKVFNVAYRTLGKKKIVNMGYWPFATQVKELNKLDLPDLSETMEQLLNEQNLVKLNPENDLDETIGENTEAINPNVNENDLNNVASENTEEINPNVNEEKVEEAVTPEAETKSKIDPEKLAAYNASLDEHELKIRKNYDRIAEIDATIDNLHKMHNAKLENHTSAFAQGFNVAEGDIMADNYDAYKDSIADLEIEKKALRDEIKNEENIRRQERIEADKKAREERLNETNQKAKVAEAKDVLSHLETSTGTYSIEGMTDEEILDTYNSIKASPSMAERLEKAKETARNDKSNQAEPKPEIEPAPEPVKPAEPVSEPKPEIEPAPEPVKPAEPVQEPKPEIEPAPEPVKPAEPVQEPKPEPELASLADEDINGLLQRKEAQENKVQGLMDKYGVTEQQARLAASDPEIMQEIQNIVGTPSEEKTEAITR